MFGIRCVRSPEGMGQELFSTRAMCQETSEQPQPHCGLAVGLMAARTVTLVEPGSSRLTLHALQPDVSVCKGHIQRLCCTARDSRQIQQILPGRICIRKKERGRKPQWQGSCSKGIPTSSCREMRFLYSVWISRGVILQSSPPPPTTSGEDRVHVRLNPESAPLVVPPASTGGYACFWFVPVPGFLLINSCSFSFLFLFKQNSKW